MKGLVGDSELEAILVHRIERAGFSAPTLGYRFAPPRRWRFDLSWPDEHLAIEVEGGVYSGGRHVRGKGYEADLEKYNTAALAGWLVLRFTRRMIEDGTAVAMLGRVLVPSHER